MIGRRITKEDGVYCVGNRRRVERKKRVEKELVESSEEDGGRSPPITTDQLTEKLFKESINCFDSTASNGDSHRNIFTTHAVPIDALKITAIKREMWSDWRRKRFIPSKAVFIRGVGGGGVS